VPPASGGLVLTHSKRVAVVHATRLERRWHALVRVWLPRAVPSALRHNSWYTGRNPWYTDKNSWYTDKNPWYTDKNSWYTDKKDTIHGTPIRKWMHPRCMLLDHTHAGFTPYQAWNSTASSSTNHQLCRPLLNGLKAGVGFNSCLECKIQPENGHRACGAA
jgi:hypothetical protein